MQFITVEQFLMGRARLVDLSAEMVGNTNTIVPRANELLAAFGEYRHCTSGYRRPEDQQRINPKATHSFHTKCLAIDLHDPDGKLDKWCLEHLNVLEKIGLWLESPDSTPGWCHLQASPPHSGHRVFIP